MNKWNRMMTTFSNGPFKDEPQIGVTYYQKGITPAPAPEAGDTSHPALLIGLAVLALCGIAVTAVQRRKCER